jgi:hypothetical protein
MRKLIYGVGECNKGKFQTKIDGKTARLYSIWSHMIQRCYCPIAMAKNPAYVDCGVDTRFLKFQEFAAWASSQQGFDKGWALDKDILIKGNKTYGPEQCIFVPMYINSLFARTKATRGANPIGVTERNGRYIAALSTKHGKRYLGSHDSQEAAFFAYKDGKERYIKEVADSWKAELDPRAYAALMAYQVEITD